MTPSSLTIECVRGNVSCRLTIVLSTVSSVKILPGILIRANTRARKCMHATSPPFLFIFRPIFENMHQLFQMNSVEPQCDANIQVFINEFYCPPIQCCYIFPRHYTQKSTPLYNSGVSEPFIPTFHINMHTYTPSPIYVTLTNISLSDSSYILQLL